MEDANQFWASLATRLRIGASADQRNLDYRRVAARQYPTDIASPVTSLTSIGDLVENDGVESDVSRSRPVS